MENILKTKQINLELAYKFIFFIEKLKNKFSIFIFSLIFPFYYLIKRKKIKEDNEIFKMILSVIPDSHYKDCEKLHLDIQRVNKFYKKIPQFILIGKFHENNKLTLEIDEFLKLKKQQEIEIKENLTEAFDELKGILSGRRKALTKEDFFAKF